MNSNTFSELNGAGLRIAVITSRFNAQLTDAMLADCLAALKTTHVEETSISSFRVPGAFELSVLASQLAAQKKFDAIICLGVIIKGETKHDQYIADAVANGLMKIAIEHRLPVIFGVLTTEDEQQAEARALGQHKKGWEAGLTAVEMAALLKTTV